jgi:hypothetical protein
VSDNEKKKDDQLPPLPLVDDGAIAAINARRVAESTWRAQYQQAYFSAPDELPAPPPIEDDSVMAVLQAAMVARTAWANRTEPAVFSSPDELPVFVPVQDDSAMVVIQASWAQRSAWVARNAPSFFSPHDELPIPLSVLLAATFFYPERFALPVRRRPYLAEAATAGEPAAVTAFLRSLGKTSGIWVEPAVDRRRELAAPGRPDWQQT